MSLLKWLIKYSNKIKWPIIVSTFLETISVLAAIAMIVIQKYVIDDIFLEGNYELFVPVMTIFGVAILTYFITHAFAFIYMRTGEITIRYEMNKDLLHHFNRLHFSKFQNERIGKMMSYFTNEINLTMAYFLGFKIMQGIVDVIRIITLFIIIGLASIPILGIILVATIFYIILGKQFSPQISKVTNQVFEERSELNTLIEEGVSSSREVVAFDRHEWELDRIRKRFKKYFEKVMQEGKLSNKLLFTSEPVKWVMNITVLCFAGYSVIMGNLTVGMLVVLYLLASQLMDAIQSFYQLMNTVMADIAVSKRMKKIMTEDELEDGHLALQGRIENITCKDVEFRYTDGEQDILKKFNLDIPIGQKTAIVGHSGAGKSTLTQLLGRLYEPQAGDLYINNMALKDIKRKDWLDRISIVFQEPYVFPDTILNNLIMGNEQITKEEIIKACKVAEIYEDIESLPEGFETTVGERGIQFSGGQRQRLALARAILRKPEILILDEATSALDLETERKVQKNLDIHCEGMTVIVIAHRLSTIVNSDLIYVLDKGKVKESGKHDYLMEQDSIYKRLIYAELEQENQIS